MLIKIGLSLWLIAAAFLVAALILSALDSVFDGETGNLEKVSFWLTVVSLCLITIGILLLIPGLLRGLWTSEEFR